MAGPVEWSSPDNHTCSFVSRPLVKTVCGNCHLRDFMASRNAGLVLTVSDLALISRAAADESFAQRGMSPHRIGDSSRVGSFGFWRRTATG